MRRGMVAFVPSLLVAAVLLAACPSSQFPAAQAWPCAHACEVLADPFDAGVTCTEGAATEAGTTCLSFCTQTAEAGFLPLPVSCVVEAGSLAALKSCGVCANLDQ